MPEISEATRTLLALFATVGEVLRQLHTKARYVLHSFRVAVCHKRHQEHLSRVFPHCKLLTGKAYGGRCASQRSWSYGLKVQVVTTSDGLPVETGQCFSYSERPS